MYHGKLLIAGLLSGLAFTAIAGCPSPNPPYLMAEDGDNVFYKVTPTPMVGMVVDHADLYRIDLQTAASELLLGGLPPFAGQVVTNGRLVAWVDGGQNAVKVKDLTSGTERDLFQGLKGTVNTLGFSVEAIDDAHLLVRYPVHPADILGLNLDQYRFSSLDLQTGAELVIDHGWRNSDFSVLVNNDLVVFINPGEGTQAIGAESRTALDVVNLDTGERKTIGPGLLPSSTLSGAKVQVVWPEYKADGLTSRVLGCDLANGQVYTIDEDFATESEVASVMDFDGAYLLIVREPRSTGDVIPLSVTAQSTLERRSLDGQFSQTVASSRVFEQGSLVGDYVVWIDGITSQLVIFDTRDGTSRVAR